MRYSKAVHDHFILEEGYRNKSYRDSRGFWTIGIGHFLGTDNAFANIKWTDEKIGEVFENDLDKSLATAKEIFPEYNTLPENVQLAILDMIFNLGPGGYRKFKQTIRLIHEGRFVEAAQSASQSAWARQVPNRAARVCKLLSNV
jgi:lysozyme